MLRTFENKVGILTNAKKLNRRVKLMEILNLGGKQKKCDLIKRLN